MARLEIIQDSKSIKKTELLSSNILKTFAPRTLKFRQAEYTEYDSGIVVNCPDNIIAYYCSLDTSFKKLEPGTTRIYLGLLNLSFTENFTLKNATLLDFYCSIQKTKLFLNIPRQSRYSTRTRKRWYRKRRRQTGFFLNRYNFGYAGRDTVNQLGKVAPGVIKEASSQMKNIAQKHIQQAISQGGKEIEQILPKILRGALEDVYHMPFRLLENLGKKQFQNIKNKILR